MLEKLALNHQLWLKMAKGICKDAYLADDLVSEMYLKFKDYKKEINEYYIYFAIKHIYYNYLKYEKRYVSLSDNFDLQIEVEIKNDLEIPDCITWVEKQILLLRQNNSGRDIGNQYHIHWRKVHRIEEKAKEKINLWLEEKK